MSKSLDIHQSLKILELDSLTTPAELKRAYRDLVHVWHPDRFQNNPRLQQRAEKRLREINLAYRHILAHLASNQPDTALTATELNRNAHIPTDKKKAAERRNGRSADNFSSADKDASRSYPGDVYSATTRRVPLRSTPGPSVFFGFLLLFFAISGTIIYFVLNSETSTFKTRSPASKALETIAITLDENEDNPRDDASHRNIIRNLGEEFARPDNKTVFEIYLKSGSIITTEAFWEKDDMIIYKIRGGSMGIEKVLIKKIVRR